MIGFTHVTTPRALVAAATLLCLTGQALAMPIGSGEVSCSARFDSCLSKCPNTSDPDECQQICADIFLECGAGLPPFAIALKATKAQLGSSIQGPAKAPIHLIQSPITKAPRGFHLRFKAP